MASIRKRLITSLVLCLLVLSLMVSTFFYFYARHTFIKQFDGALESKARAMATLVETDGQSHIEMEFSDANMPEFLDKKSPQYFQVWLADGSVLRKSQSLGKGNLPHLKKNDRDHRRTEITLPNGKRGRMIQLNFHLQLEINEKRPFPPDTTTPKATIALARDSNDLDETLDSLLLIMISGSLLVPGIAALLVWAAVRWGLRPVDTLTTEIDKIDSPSEFGALSVADLPQELKPIARRLNSMMDRLKSAFDRERQFTLDASHELRTPLTEARTALEVALKWPSDSALMESSCADALGAMQNMESLVAALLALARAESGLLDLKHDTVTLEPLIDEGWRRVRSRAEERGLSFRLEGTTYDSQLTVDRSLLLAVVTNLLDNAVEYCRENSEILAAIIADVDESHVQLQISNQLTLPLTQDDLDHIFEPLWRKESSRANAESSPYEKVHAGLGLSLIQSFCRMMNIDVKATLPKTDVFLVTLRIPKNLL